MNTEPIAEVRARRGAEGQHGSAAQGMFERIAPTYDLLNRVLSAGLDARWRRKAVHELRRAPPGPLLDLCAGTMDLSSVLAKAYPHARLVALDFSPARLEKGRRKAPRAEVVVGDATALPFADGEFAAVVCGFGMRNLSDTRAGMKEVLRVLRPGGVFVTLELFRADGVATRAFHGAYARFVLPTVGGLLSGDRGAYRYLAASMAGFLTRREYEQALSAVGFVGVRSADLALGVASIVTGEVRT